MSNPVPSCRPAGFSMRPSLAAAALLLAQAAAAAERIIVVAADGTPPERAYGVVFIDSEPTGDPTPWVDPSENIPTKASASVPRAYLGRPWRPFGSVTFVNTGMGAHIHPAGWNNWGKPANGQTARYAEYNSRGAGAIPAGADGWQPQ